MKRWNLKRLQSGVYTDPNGRFYALKCGKYWSVGYIENHSFQHVDDLKSFAAARYWIKERASI